MGCRMRSPPSRHCRTRILFPIPELGTSSPALPLQLLLLLEKWRAKRPAPDETFREEQQKYSTTTESPPNYQTKSEMRDERHYTPAPIRQSKTVNQSVTSIDQTPCAYGLPTQDKDKKRNRLHGKPRPEGNPSRRRRVCTSRKRQGQVRVHRAIIHSTDCEKKRKGAA